MLIVVLLLVLSLPLPALSLYTDGTGGRFSGDGFSISLSDLSLYLDAGPLSYGAVDTGGLLRFLSKPHSAVWDLTPVARRPSSSSLSSGFVVEAGPLSAGWTVSGREMVYASLSGQNLEGAIVYAEGEGDDGSLQKETGTGTEDSSLYLALKGGYRWLSAFAVLSFAPDIGFLPMLGVKAEAGDYSLSFTYGDIFDLTSSSGSFTWGLSLSMGDEGFYARFTYSEGLSPVYSYDYLEKEASLDVSLDFLGVLLSSSMNYSRSSTGTVSKEAHYLLSVDCLAIGWDSEDGLFWEWDLDAMALGFEDGEPYVAIRARLGESDAAISLRLSLGGEAGIGLSFSA